MPMEQISKDILRRFQVRKTRDQKSAFIEFMREHFPELRIEEGGFPRCRNLIIGDADNAEILLSAHYDTCARLPFPNFICPQNLLLYILYSLLICIPFFIVSAAADALLSFISDSFAVHFAISILLFFGLFYLIFIGGKPNQHTANDNTSGVIALCEIYAALSPEEREKTAFIFFDHEESGLFGSAFFRKKHRSASKAKLLINFDCVSDGDHILIVRSSKARKKYGSSLDAAFADMGGKTVHMASSAAVIYPSDQAGFPLGVAVAAMHKAPLVGLYLSRIHTARDTVFDEENLRFIRAGIKKFYSQLQMEADRA